MSLLDNAKAVQRKVSIQKVPSDEGMELAIAWAKREVNTAQAASAMGVSGQKAASHLNKYLRYAVATGKLK